MFPDSIYSLPLTNPLGSVRTSNHTYLATTSDATAISTSDGRTYSKDLYLDHLLATTFGGLTDEEIRTACIAYYPERFI